MVTTVPKDKHCEQNDSQHQNKKKYYFKITLDAPLIERRAASRKTAVTDRVINDTCDAFQDCNIEKIAGAIESETSDFLETIILNNEEDNNSTLFQDETTVFKMSQSIR